MLHRPGQSLRIQTNQRSRFAPPSSVQDERDAKEALNHLSILCRLRRQTQFLCSLVLSHGHHRKPPVIHSGRACRHPLQGIPMIMLFRESYYCPGAWVPHITLSHGTRSVARAIEVASSLWSGPIKGWADRVDLVRFHPVEVLRSKILRSTSAAAD